MKPYCVVFFLLFSVGNITSQNFSRISKKILKFHHHIDEITTRNEQYYNLRKEIKILEKLHNRQECDTIYLLEFHAEPANPFLYMLGWNRSDTLHIYAEDNLSTIEFDNDLNDVFPKYMIDLVSKWNYKELEKEGKLYPGNISLENVFATRIIFNKSRYSIDCMYFEAFFNFDRDYIYRPYIKKDD